MMSFLNQYDAIPPADAAKRKALPAGWLRTDARAFFAELREQRPIFQTPGITYVTCFPDVIEVLNQPTVFSVRLYGMKMDDSVGPFMLGQDRTEINWNDKSVMKSVMPLTDLPRVRELAGTMADQALKSAVQDGKVEVVRNLGRGVPVRIVGEYFGFPGPDEDTMLRWSRATQSDYFKNLTNNPEVHQACVQATQEMAEYLTGLIAERRSKLAAGGCGATTDDVVSRLLAMNLPSGLGLGDDARLITNISGLLIGAVETASQAIVQALNQILQRPDIHKQAVAAAQDESLDAFDAIVWEALRFDPINPLVFRFTENDATIAAGTDREAVIPAGTVVFACTASAMWDGQELDRPDDFIPGRPAYHYMHMGYGEHICLGNEVGRVVLCEVVRKILLRGVALLPDGETTIDFGQSPFPERYEIAVTGKA